MTSAGGAVRSGSVQAWRAGNLLEARKKASKNTGMTFRVQTMWFFLFFVFAVFFFAQHILNASQVSTDGYNMEANDIVGAVSSGSIIRQISMLSLGAVSCLLLYVNRSVRVLRLQTFGGLLAVAFTAWVMLSPLWAEDRSLTLTRTITFLLLALGAVAVAKCVEPSSILLWAYWANLAYIMAGVLAEIVLGTFRPWVSGYRFAGTLHPNGQGLQCGLLLLASATVWSTSPKHRRLLYFSLPLTLGLALLTRSRTGVLASLVALVVYTMMVIRGRTRALIIMSVAVCVAALALFAGFDSLNNASRLGRTEDAGSDQSFNGRTQIWDSLEGYVWKRPAAGYGYGGFWTPNRISDMSEDEGWGVAASHSAYLDCALAVGLVGLALYIGALIMSVWIACRRFLQTRHPFYAFAVAVLLLFILDGFLDSVILGISFMMFLCMAIIIQVNFAPQEAWATLPSSSHRPLWRRRQAAIIGMRPKARSQLR